MNDRTTWNVELTSEPLPAGMDIEAFTDELLSALIASPQTAAEVLSTNLRERTVSPLLNVEAEGIEGAVSEALRAFEAASHVAGCTLGVASIEAAAVEELIPA